MEDATKAGNRNNADDRKTIREIRIKAKEIVDHTMNMEPDDDDMTPAERLQKFMVSKAITGELEFREISLPFVAVKASGDWELDVLGVPFGGPKNGKDLQGEYFTSKTKTFIEEFKEIPVFYFHGLNPSGRPEASPQTIGKAKFNRTDDKGHWYKVVLDKASKYAEKIWNAAQKGIARASSGSIAHLVRVKSDGEITSWPVTEMTLVDESEGRHPVNSFAVALPVMKALYESAGLTLPEITRNGDQPEATGDVAATPAVKSNLESAKAKPEVIEMTEEEMLKLLDERDARKAAEAKKAAEAAENEQLRKENEELKAEAAKANRLPFGKGSPHVNAYADTVKYDGLSTADLALMVDVQHGLHIGSQASTKRMPEVSKEAYKALMLRVMHIENDQVSHETAAYAKQALKASFAGGYGKEPTDEAIRDAFKSTTANVMYTGGSSDMGEDWVGTAYSNQLWEAIRAGAQVASKVPSVTIPDGYNNQYFPLEGADPTWYKVAEAAASEDTIKVPQATVTASYITTLNKQITLGKMGCRTIYSGEMVEDSLIAFVPQLRQQMQASGTEQLEHVLIDGDTATSTNINDIGGTTYSGAATTLFLLADGFRKVGIANGRSAAGSLSEDDYLETVRKIGLNGIGADPSKVGIIVDPNTYFKSLKLSTLKTKDVWAQATLESGTLTRLWNYPIMASWFMHWRQTNRKANSAGKVDLDTAGNNLYGGILAVRWDQWKLAYKRRMTMETTRIANADSWEIVALTRLGLGYRDAYAAAETFYVGI